MSAGRNRRDVRRVIATATGLLMSAHRMTDSEAYRWLQANAMKHRTSLLAVADSVIAAAGQSPALPGGSPDGRSPGQASSGTCRWAITTSNSRTSMVPIPASDVPSEETIPTSPWLPSIAS